MTTTHRSNGNDTNLNDLALATPAYYDVLKKKHFSSPRFDCVAFTRAVSKCAELLDPTKFLLTKLDLDCSEQLLGIKEEVHLLAAYVKYVVDLYESLPSRKEQIDELLRSLIGKTHNFTVVESLPEYVELQDYAQSMDELADRWRRLVKLHFLANRDTTTTKADIAE
jgi:hypothetical protein